MQLVADEDERQTFAGHLPQGGKKAFGLLRGQDGGGFVEDKNAGIIIERFEDFHTLAFADGKIRDAGVGLDL